MRVPVRKTGAGEFNFPTRIYQTGVHVDTVVPARLKVADEVNSPSQRAAAHIQKPVRRVQSLRLDEVKLEPADLVPQAPDKIPVFAFFDLRLGQLPLVIMLPLLPPRR